jgi:uncharacterized membrane protein YcaP (DUF421 family)
VEEEAMTRDLLVLQLPLLEKVLRTIAVYLFLVLALRLAGKRELAQLNSFDLVVLLLLSNTVQNAIIGPDNSLLGAYSARRCCWPPTTLVRLGFQHTALARALEGISTTLVQDGRMLDDNLRRYLITREELMAAIRRQGGRNLQDIEVVVLEASGALTVGQHDHIHEVLERLQRIEAAVTHGQGSRSAR